MDSSALSVLKEEAPMTSHMVFTSVRQIMEVSIPVEADVRTELDLIHSALSGFKTFASDSIFNIPPTTAGLIFDCYWVYVEKINEKVNALDSVQRDYDNSHFLWHCGPKLWQSRKLIRKFWIFNYTLLSTLSLLSL